ncbi:GNAT family N-acetyltransferase [Alkalihalobacillus sp. AL-G]|uniref:GNAT family N-acetyltransferase n=1 Tax=Alkalihalobacillus sp. AL-G TaxID=2926399 RepID=UPI00272C7CEB|nr:GNAT family protein [Alkalihalobacillus sp. AL-G]WLD94550.1 GNAT family N-acetyltransferase [Alkalihalobacillus sp. AL-G]
MDLKGNKIFLKFLETSDTEAVLNLEVENKNFFQDYGPLREGDFYTLEGQRNRIKRNHEAMEKDLYYDFGVYQCETNKLIGLIHLSGVVRGPLQSAWLGYYLDKNHNGKGYMTEAVKLIVSYAFEQLNLHRIEAGVMPHNVGSIKVLEKAGFLKEGIARKNVKINGKWEDHQTLAIINGISS